jgi:hypothetical protein
MVTLPLVVADATVTVKVFVVTFATVYASSCAVPLVKSKYTLSPFDNPWLAIVTVQVVLPGTSYVPDKLTLSQNVVLYVTDVDGEINTPFKRVRLPNATPDVVL